MIKKTFPNASMTIMGDLNQRIDKHSNVKNKDGITKVFNDIKTVVLTKSYRSTYNITNFAKELYLAAKGNPDIDTNIKLKRLVEKAKKQEVPNDIIKRAIDKAKGANQESYDPCHILGSNQYIGSVTSGRSPEQTWDGYRTSDIGAPVDGIENLGSI